MSTAAETDAPRGGAGGWIRAHRRGLAYALVALACLLTLVVSMSVWVNQQLLDTDVWVDQSQQMLQNEDVRHALALRLVDAAYSEGDVEARLADRLPPRLQGLAPQIAGALRPAAVDAAEALLERPAVQKLWEEANRVAHSRLVDVLEGNEGGVVTTGGGDVVLNVGDMVARLRSELGLTGTQRVPEDAAITIMHSDDLEAAQTYVRVIKVVSVFAAIIVVALLVLAIWLAAGSRREVVRAAAWGLLAVGLILLVVRRLVGNAVIDALATPEGQPAAREVWTLSTTVMRDLGLGLVTLGLLGLLWALIAGGHAGGHVDPRPHRAGAARAPGPGVRRRAPGLRPAAPVGPDRRAAGAARDGRDPGRRDGRHGGAATAGPGGGRGRGRRPPGPGPAPPGLGLRRRLAGHAGGAPAPDAAAAPPRRAPAPRRRGPPPSRRPAAAPAGAAGRPRRTRWRWPRW